MRTLPLAAALCFATGTLALLQPSRLPAQPYATKSLPQDKFRQLEELLPTPNDQRTASGAPGRGYWQQRADYVIDAELDDTTQIITGKETITYHNRSPDALAYLWLQLDANIFSKNSDRRATATQSRTAPRGASPAAEATFTASSGGVLDPFPARSLEALLLQETYDSDLRIAFVTDAAGQPLPHTIVQTMMRIDLPAPLAPGASTTFTLTWSYKVNDGKLLSLRSGWEYFPKDKNYIYEIAQWFPRLAAYNDTMGWQHKQYLGTGEFTLEFGDYLVRLTVPDDHIVAGTGVLQNQEQVLTAVQRERLKSAATAAKPVFIVTPDEAKKAEAGQPTGKKTWIFRAENVRDFAFATSRRFIWDAMGAPDHVTAADLTKPGPKGEPRSYGPRVLAMSFYPKEAEVLWSKFSTHAVIHTLDVYSARTIPFPYPAAQSVNGCVSGGMEYPMISFNGGRPEDDGTYSRATKAGLIGVIIHEVGHNYFPMIVNSDERQWTWMDEGLNTFLQNQAEQLWEKDFPSRRAEPSSITAYMTSAGQVPIMTNSESIANLGSNAYAKPTAALGLLRETVLGRELFDHAFKTYAKRWAFKRPYPADFFRTMEDASGVDLDWFWRGWFYTNDHCDLSIDAVRQFTLDSRDPAIEKPNLKKEKDERPVTLMQQRNADLPKRTDRYPELKDFYNDYDEFAVTAADRRRYDELIKGLQRNKGKPELLKTARNFYVVEISNVGGLVMPVILKLDYTDGSTEELRIPAEIWRFNSAKVQKLIMTPKEIKSMQLDPHEETADAEVDNNFWPRRTTKSRFQLFQSERGGGGRGGAGAADNPMQEAKREAEAAAKKSAPAAKIFESSDSDAGPDAGAAKPGLAEKPAPLSATESKPKEPNPMQEQKAGAGKKARTDAAKKVETAKPETP
ncbi:MAG: M1 family peptidase [Opitutus sp.]|nr:M1 family peptidase [Opitutus sp.]